MRILVVNDDGIKAPGIKRLVQMAAGLGEVWVVAPAAQCSAMSHRITGYADGLCLCNRDHPGADLGIFFCI